MKVCKTCVMDSETDPDLILVNDKCNHCIRYENQFNSRVDTDEKAFKEIIKTIKLKGKNRKYDCIVGLSGGVDSSYVAILAKRYGLRPLAFHLDNGWNSELAVKNIEVILKNYDIPLVTKVLNWEEFRKIQLSFLKSGVPDGEIPTDHAINASIWDAAAKYKIPYILSGMNFQTESIMVPNWSYGHMDARYVKSVIKKNDGPKLRSFPTLSLVKLAFYTFLFGIRSISILNYIDYNKDKVISELKEIGWSPYENKHYESSYTKFYQGYVLDHQFNIDKRKGHLSDLIFSGQMTREKAFIELERKPLDDKEIRLMKMYVARKFKITLEELEVLLSRPRKNRNIYKSNKAALNFIKSAVNFFRENNLYPK